MFFSVKTLIIWI